MTTCEYCEGYKSEIEAIIEMARDKPTDLIEWLKVNFPKEWGLSMEEHTKLLTPD